MLPATERPGSTVRLEGWRLVGFQAGYQPPEEWRQRRLAGNVFDHPCFAEGALVTTSVIQKAAGRYVWTRNTLYLLGMPDPAYAAWVEKTTGQAIDPDHPIESLDEKE